MPEASKKSRKNNSRKWIKRFIYFLIIATLFTWSYAPIKTRIVQKRQIERLNDQLASEKEINSKLKTELERLREDDEYIEKIAREKLGMIRADEEGYVVIEEDSTEEMSDEEQSSNKKTSKRKSWLQRIISVFD